MSLLLGDLTFESDLIDRTIEFNDRLFIECTPPIHYHVHYSCNESIILANTFGMKSILHDLLVAKNVDLIRFDVLWNKKEDNLCRFGYHRNIIYIILLVITMIAFFFFEHGILFISPL